MRIILDSKEQEKRKHEIDCYTKPVLIIGILLMISIFMYDWFDYLEIRNAGNSGIILCFATPWMNCLLYIPLIIFIGGGVSIFTLWNGGWSRQYRIDHFVLLFYYLIAFSDVLFLTVISLF